MLEERGERVHPASRWLASESAHIESEAGEHDLAVFQAVRQMDEIIVANFMVFADLVEDEPYDLWIVDEGWDVDHFLHDNPELKRTAYAWLTDFVGWLPMAEGGARRGGAHRGLERRAGRADAPLPPAARPLDLRGEPGDPVDVPLGPGLPTARELALERYAFAGYVTGFEPPADREALRAELGFRPDERVCLVTVGGSGVGTHLLRRVVEAFPPPRSACPACGWWRWPARGSTRSRSRRPTASRCTVTFPTCTGTSPPATWPSCRAG